MEIGIPKERKENEQRVVLTPASVFRLCESGHCLLLEKGAGEESGYSDEDFAEAGARLVSKEDVFQAEMLLKVKEPQREEWDYLQRGQILFSYLHLAPQKELTAFLCERGLSALAFETIEGAGGLPLLLPMSEMAGRIATQMGAYLLQGCSGGRGILLGGLAGVPPAKVFILGGGVVGREAARIALGMRARVCVMDHNPEALRSLQRDFSFRVETLCSKGKDFLTHLVEADLLIGALLVTGRKAPRLVSRREMAMMKKNAVFIDVSIDQGGCAESSRMTTHADPIYREEGVVHYCVGNMPGACARTATRALSHALLPYLLSLGEKGFLAAIKDSQFKGALNVHAGEVCHLGLAEDLGYTWRDPQTIG